MRSIKEGALQAKNPNHIGSQPGALVARTPADARDFMIEGPSGILALSHPSYKPTWNPSKRRLTWPDGTFALVYSAENPEEIRGPNVGWFWADELASWRYRAAWDNLMFTLRLGSRPRGVITSTPRPTALVREILADKATVVTGGSTRDNSANLSASFLDYIDRKYGGTRLGRQEIEGLVIDDNPRALWKKSMLDAHRVDAPPSDLRRIVVAIDPAVTSNIDSDDTGIVVAGVRDVNGEDHGFVLQDMSGKYTPPTWARLAVALYQKWQADAIVAEVNNGGDLVETTIRAVDPSVRYIAVRASRGKAIRAEPVAALDEQGKIHHVGSLPELEDQLCDWDPTQQGSPDRLDARVWAITELMLTGEDPEPTPASMLDGLHAILGMR